MTTSPTVDLARARELLAKLRVQPTVTLPDMGPRTVNVATSIRQLFVERAEAADVIDALLAFSSREEPVAPKRDQMIPREVETIIAEWTGDTLARGFASSWHFGDLWRQLRPVLSVFYRHPSPDRDGVIEAALAEVEKARLDRFWTWELNYGRSSDGDMLYNFRIYEWSDHDEEAEKPLPHWGTSISAVPAIRTALAKALKSASPAGEGGNDNDPDDPDGELALFGTMGSFLGASDEEIERPSQVPVPWRREAVMSDNRYVYGARCAWSGPISAVGHLPSGLPCCPHCKSALFEMSDAEWWAGVDKYEKAHPGYRAMVEWASDKHFLSFDEMTEAYRKHGEAQAMTTLTQPPEAGEIMLAQRLRWWGGKRKAQAAGLGGLPTFTPDGYALGEDLLRAADQLVALQAEVGRLQEDLAEEIGARRDLEADTRSSHESAVLWQTRAERAEAQVERLHALLNERDDFIVAQGLWQQFVDGLVRAALSDKEG